MNIILLNAVPIYALDTKTVTILHTITVTIFIPITIHLFLTIVSEVLNYLLITILIIDRSKLVIILIRSLITLLTNNSWILKCCLYLFINLLIKTKSLLIILEYISSYLLIVLLHILFNITKYSLSLKPILFLIFLLLNLL